MDLMTKKQRDRLAPFADQLHAWQLQIIAMPEDELIDLRAACSAASATNCWCEIFRAAQIILPMVRREIVQREVTRATQPALSSG